MKNILFVLGTVFGISLTSMNVGAEIIYASIHPDLVKCRIDVNGRTVVNGQCGFWPEKGGSFSLVSESRSTALFNSSLGEVHSIDVNINKNGNNSIVANGYTNNSSYRENGAIRSKANKACWSSKTMFVCAWK